MQGVLEILIRKLSSYVARRFPPKFVSDRILPWITLALAILGVTWSLIEFQNSNHASRVERTLSLHKFYFDNKLNDDFHRQLRSNIDDYDEKISEDFCAYVDEILENQKDDESALIKCSPERDNISEIILSEKQKSEARARYNKIVASIILEDPDLKATIYSLADFYAGIVICVESNACDREMAFNYFLVDIIGFVNLTCSFFDKVAASERLKEVDVFLARFIIKHNIDRYYLQRRSTNHRSGLFICKTLRKLERDTSFERFYKYWFEESSLRRF